MGKYIRVWVYDSNMPLLNSLEKGELSKTVNNALQMYMMNDTSSMPNVTLSRAGLSSDFLGGVQTSQVQSSKAPTCPNGHLIVNGTGHCISTACQYNK